ncbi:hypothetical protein PQR70_36445 [Paraburkholderia madseniana]|jgi:hypothetical protein|uniref:hypothetical protein n=1 Tax=Paraburkholderia madseniana TaxID=2599607 RepID=UPI0038BB3578
MRVAKKGVMVSMLILGLSGATYAMGAGGGGEGGGAGSAGQGGTGMGTPNASGATDTMSGASGANTMGKSDSKSKKQMQKKGTMDSPASGSDMKSDMKKTY